ncbi:MAG TPA: glucuronate isomerase, partial [Gemmatales bacterium]|nr:glucuronate isomerase [Gemmatales bacterium]
DPLERTRFILKFSKRFANTVQWSWMMELCRIFFGWHRDTITDQDADELWQLAHSKMSQPDWAEQVLKASHVENVFLTNEFDDSLEGLENSCYVPCLRTDDLVFKLLEPEVQQRLHQATGVETHDAGTVQRALEKLFSHFQQRGAKACAISLPPTFEPGLVSEHDFNHAFKAKEQSTVAKGIFWKLAQCCDSFELPFDLMIGVNRRVYERGVYQGQDLLDQRTSLIQYAPLFNAFPNVKFCISVLTSSQNQELASYSWIFPNVYTSGHWWNIPTLIEHDLKLRLQAVPGYKQIGYYSDAYKLEFILPKYNMYRKILAKLLAQEFVLDRKWTEEQAVALGKELLRGNTERIFYNMNV